MKNTLFIAVAFATISFASCNNAGTNSEAPKVDSACMKAQMKADKNKKTAMAVIDGINAHSADKVFETGDVANFTEYGDGEMAPVKGDSAKKMLAMYLASFEPKVENAQYVAEGNTVMILSDYTLTFKNEFMGMKPNGKSVQGKDVDILTFDDNGKVTSHRNIYPNGAIFMKMGMDMAKMQAMMSGGAKPEEKKK